ncbi:MAG: twin-arginine translocase TatA/TatE family subunit [Marinifilaceae bacterium]|jgi:sec-independent protein translocase protein TatA|nr:twin-arginine translocase TatA/TatE family subunit [Marinifilaceae bacterium]
MISIILSIGVSEILIIFIVYLLCFGAKGLPEIARSIGKAINEFKRTTEDLKENIKSGSENIEGVKEVKENIKDIKDKINLNK